MCVNHALQRCVQGKCLKCTRHLEGLLSQSRSPENGSLHKPDGNMRLRKDIQRHVVKGVVHDCLEDMKTKNIEYLEEKLEKKHTTTEITRKHNKGSSLKKHPLVYMNLTMNEYDKKKQLNSKVGVGRSSNDSNNI